MECGNATLTPILCSQVTSPIYLTVVLLFQLTALFSGLSDMGNECSERPQLMAGLEKELISRFGILQ